MSQMLAEKPIQPVEYPESDGKPMSDNTKQGRWMVKIHGNIEAMLADQIAFVALNVMWYARRDRGGTCQAVPTSPRRREETRDRRAATAEYL